MPRPGPRPYECVRRAWHSDRHQPIRGSLIQEIFRVVNEIHRPATKKNKEWQEKLPIVVLKAEEILYSKANSESEYMDLENLLERTTDAINTIIRRDESTETGDLLHPCIEAALTLGCTPRRSSRSQRNCSPQRYLNCGSQEKPTLHKEIPTSDRSLCTNIFQARTNLIGSDKVNLWTKDLGATIQTRPPSSAHTVYPLYYPDTSTQARSFHVLHDQSTRDGNSWNHHRSEELNDEGENEPDVKCDLSLRLGPNTVHLFGIRNSNPSAEVCNPYGERARRDSESSLLQSMKNPVPIKMNSPGDLQMINADSSFKKRKVFYGSKYLENQPQGNTFL